NAYQGGREAGRDAGRDNDRDPASSGYSLLPRSGQVPLQNDHRRSTPDLGNAWWHSETHAREGQVVNRTGPLVRSVWPLLRNVLPPIVVSGLRRINSEWRYEPRGAAAFQNSGWDDPRVAAAHTSRWQSFVNRTRDPAPLSFAFEDPRL